MPTLVGKKYKYKDTSISVKVLQDLPNDEILCKRLDGTQMSIVHVVYKPINLTTHWTEVREPRIIYINEYPDNVYFSWGGGHSSEEKAKKHLAESGSGVTRKFIEVLD
jgi:hypothetical protein